MCVLLIGLFAPPNTKYPFPNKTKKKTKSKSYKSIMAQLHNNIRFDIYIVFIFMELMLHTNPYKHTHRRMKNGFSLLRVAIHTNRAKENKNCIYYVKRKFSKTQLGTLQVQCTIMCILLLLWLLSCCCFSLQLFPALRPKRSCVLSFFAFILFNVVMFECINNSLCRCNVNVYYML